MWSNFHMHSHYCDGKGPIRDYISQAIELKMLSIGFSSHAPVPFPCVWCMKRERLEDYLTELDTLCNTINEIEIYKSLEIDFVPNVVGPHQFEDRLDYTIGSIHFVDPFPDGRHWEIDGLHSTFLEGLDKIFSNDIKKAITRYYELTIEMLETSCPDVLGHMDKIKIQNIENKFFHEQDNWYQILIDKTLDSVKKNDVIVEVNTRGLYQGKSETPYPTQWILEKLYARRIPITLSSDTHHPSDIINRFDDMARLIAKIGFETIQVFVDHQWQPLSFNEHGIIR